MRQSIVLAGTLVLLLAVSTASAAEPPSREEALARELLEVTGAAEMSDQMVRQMMGSMTATLPEVSRELSEAILAEMDFAALLDLVVPLYEKHFTAEEMEAAIAFYRTPAGQSMLRKMPQVMAESMQLSQQWGAEAAERAFARIEAEREGAAPRP